MATTTRRTRKATATKGKTTATAAKKTTTKAAKAEDGPSKRELLAEQNAANTERIIELREAESSWAEIATELSITPGKAQYLMMCHLVEEGEVPAITYRNDDELVRKCAAARAKADQYSSWGWISARAGVSPGKIWKMLEESGDYTPKAENIAAVRAEKNGSAPKKGNVAAKGKPAPKAATAAAKKSTATTAKATAARKRAARTAGKGKAS